MLKIFTVAPKNYYQAPSEKRLSFVNFNDRMGVFFSENQLNTDHPVGFLFLLLYLK